MQTLPEDFKNIIYKPSPGLHIILNIDREKNLFVEYFTYYNGSDELDNKLSEISFYERFSSYITMNQQQKFDKKQKIHSSSPFSLAFNFSFGNNDKKKQVQQTLQGKINEGEISDNLNVASKKYKIKEVKGRIKDYLINSKKLCLEQEDEDVTSLIEKFYDYCSEALFNELPSFTMEKTLSNKKDNLEIETAPIWEDLKEKDYIRVYLKAIDKKIWKQAYTFYYESEYPPNELKENDFLTTYSAKKIFNIHQTASFDKNLLVSGKEAKALQEFRELLAVKPQSILPRPLPIFIFKEEMQEDMINFFKESSYTLSYKDLITKMWNKHKNDFGNYYLIYWIRGKEPIQDFDFVSKFEYELKDEQGRFWEIQNLFEIKEKECKELKMYPILSNVFDLERFVFKRIVGNKFKNIDYFKDIDAEDYKDRKANPNKHYDHTFRAYTKYRKAIYDFVYKSKREGVNQRVFSEMIFNSAKDALNQNDSYSIKEKLNIWFSLYEKFDSHLNHEKSMASKLKEYQQFVAHLAEEKANPDEATIEQFAFATGQVIYYILKKSKSSDQSYQRLERYLQQSDFEGFKNVITAEFARYKHENYSRRFERVASFVLTFETNGNVKKYLPQILAGVFAKNLLFSEKEKTETNTTEIENELS